MSTSKNYKNLTIDNALLMDTGKNIHFGSDGDLILYPKYIFGHEINNNNSYLLINNNNNTRNFSLAYKKTRNVYNTTTASFDTFNYLWKTSINNDGEYVLSQNINPLSSDNEWTDIVKFRRQLNGNNTSVAVFENINITGSMVIETNLTLNGNFSSDNIKITEENLGIGKNVLLNNNKGKYNTTLGNLSLVNNLNGNNNVSIGYKSLFNNTNGVRNIAIGALSFEKNTTGSNNVCIGLNSLKNNVKGDYNTCIGSNSNNDANVKNIVGTTTIGGKSMTKDNFSTAIGYGSVCDISHQIMLGRESETVFVPGKLKIKTTNGNYKNIINDLILIDASYNNINKTLSVLNQSVVVQNEKVSNLDVSKNQINTNVNTLTNKYNLLLDDYNRLNLLYNNVDTSYNKLNNFVDKLIKDVAELKVRVNNKVDIDSTILKINNSFDERLVLKPLVPDD